MTRFANLPLCSTPGHAACAVGLRGPTVTLASSGAGTIAGFGLAASLLSRSTPTVFVIAADEGKVHGQEVHCVPATVAVAAFVASSSGFRVTVTHRLQATPTMPIAATEPMLALVGATSHAIGEPFYVDGASPGGRVARATFAPLTGSSTPANWLSPSAPYGG